MTEDGGSDLLRELGALVLEASRVEGLLVTAAVVYGTEEASPTFVRLAKSRASDVLGELRGLDLPWRERVDDVFERLGGRTGLLEKRNKLVHAVWRVADDGTADGANFRVAAQGFDPKDGLTIDAIVEARLELGEAADQLNAWLFREPDPAFDEA